MNPFLAKICWTNAAWCTSFRIILHLFSFYLFGRMHVLDLLADEAILISFLALHAHTHRTTQRLLSLFKWKMSLQSTVESAAIAKCKITVWTNGRLPVFFFLSLLFLSLQLPALPHTKYQGMDLCLPLAKNVCTTVNCCNYGTLQPLFSANGYMSMWLLQFLRSFAPAVKPTYPDQSNGCLPTTKKYKNHPLSSLHLVQ